MTQRQLAGESLSVSYVSLLEAGRRTPTPETVRELARALSCDVSELTGESDSLETRPALLVVSHGRLALEAGQTEVAEQQFRAALSTPGLDPLLRSEAMIGMARVLEQQGRLEQAAKAYESLVKEAMEASAYLTSLQLVIRWARCLYELGELPRVIEVGMGVIEQLDRLDAWESDGAIQILSTVAAAHFELGDVRQAEALLREGLGRADRMRSPKARAAVLWNSSQIACERGRYREALDFANEALSFFRQDNDRRNTGRMLTAYGCILLYHDPPRVGEARTVFEEALDSLAHAGSGVDRGYVLTELSRVRLLEGDTAGAIESAERSLVELGPEAQLEWARATTALAAALAVHGEVERSREMFTRAARALGQLGVSRQASRAWVELGDMLVQSGDSAGAAAAFRKASEAVNLVPPPSGGSSRAVTE
jgi:tetratricopeptide (TPR) repeat protein